MSSRIPPGVPGTSSRRTGRWQLALVAFALAALFLKVLVPLDALVFAFSALVGFFGAREGLKYVGALESGPFGGAVYLCGTLLALALALQMLLAGWALIRRISGETRPLTFLLRWPWWTLGGLLLLALSFSLPSVAGGSEVPGFSGALILTTAVWAVMSVGYLLYRATLGGLSLAWRLARLSPFGAGMMTVGALACVGAVKLFGALVEEAVAQVDRNSLPRADFSCETSALECTRQFFLAQSSASVSSSPARPVSLAPPQVHALGMNVAASMDGSRTATQDEWESERDRQTRKCLDTQYQKRDLLDQARRLAASIINPADAWDLVHTTLLSVCLRAGERENFEVFFLRSVQNGAYSWLRHPGNVRTCSIDVTPDPVCDTRPDEEYVRGELQETVRQALCRLGDEHRQVLLLSYYDEQSDLEISQRLGISHAAVRKRLQRARAQLGEELLQQCQ